MARLHCALGIFTLIDIHGDGSIFEVKDYKMDACKMSDGSFSQQNNLVAMNCDLFDKSGLHILET